MSAIDRTHDAVAYLHDHLRDMLKRRLCEGAGLVLMTLALLGAIALATWSVQDPSLSHATTAPIRNLLGAPGAIMSDLATQLFGVAACLLLLPVAVLGWRLIAHRPLGDLWRVICWIALPFAAAAVAGCLPRTAHWPLPTGLGGVIGDAVLAVPGWLFGDPNALGRLVYALIFASAAVALLIVAFGFFASAPATRRDAHVEEEDEAEKDAADETEERESRFAIVLGLLAHGMMSLKSRLWRAIKGTPRTMQRVAPAAPVARGRVEPRFDGGDARRAPAPQAVEDDDSDEEYEDDEAEEEAAPAPRRVAAKPAKKPARRGSGYDFPPLSILAQPKASDRQVMSQDQLQGNAQSLESVLQDFGVRGEIINARPGPVVTLYELEPAPGIKSSRVIGLADDIARSMSAVSARVAVVPGRNAIGIELPNAHREKVYFREQLQSREYTDTTAKLPLCLGKTIGGEPVIVDLARMPHLLIAGTTGSGKSVAINTMLLSLLYKLRPDQCRMILIDPKMLELSVYEGIPHLLTPVVTDPKKAVVALKWAVREMEERYKKMSKLGVRNIDGYNARLAEAKAKGEALTRTVHTGYDKETGEAIYEKEDLELDDLPYIVVVVDEMADLMMVAGKDIEGAIQRLAQMARAAGIHVVLATQRPSVDVITGTIKANFPTRISFQVTSKIDSRTILGEQGAEQLLGQGDMLYMAGGGRISRVHGPFCSDDEVEKIVRHLKTQGVPQYLEEVTASDEPEEGEDGAVFDSTGMGLAEGGDIYQQAVAIVKRDRKASTSYIQRRLQIGYNRAATIMERMEQEGIVGQANHAGKREILIPEDPGSDRF
ncbi:MAG: DNA translocase FtsK [Rhizobiales bacterium]|nr:DNA translocase FtsK [Hyphomicrobiales bacterium]OJY41080.1 MAG: cell division protein FtsK [Rhizobiales bacterium 64-17]